MKWANATRQFERNIELHSPTEGWIVLDILKSRRVGGVEFVSKIADTGERGS